jgi:hypothetical protein
MKALLQRMRAHTESPFGLHEIKFVPHHSVVAMIAHLVSQLKKVKADRVLVVSGFVALQSISADEFPGYEYLYNSSGSFGWLLKICEYAREARNPQIIVSRFPRYWNPPRIKVVQASFNPGMFVTADRAIDGTILEVEASACAQFMNNPKSITLNVIEENDTNSTLAVYFLGLHASSYYREVLASQGCPPRIPVDCRVISGLDDPALDSEECDRLKDARGLYQKAAILEEVSKTLETFCTSSAQRCEKQEYTGGVLIPAPPKNEQLPPGARSM